MMRLSILRPCLPLLLATAVLEPGCAGPEGGGLPGGAQPLVIDRPPVEPADDPGNVYWNTLFTNLTKASKDNDLRRMNELLGGARGGKKPRWAEEKLAFFRGNLRARTLVSEGRIRALFTMARPHYASGEVVVPRLRIENQMADDLVLPVPGARAVVHMEVVIQDRNVYGEISENRITRNFPLPESLRIPPGKWRESRDTPFQPVLMPGVVLRNIYYKGSIRLSPGFIEAAGERLPLTLMPVGTVQFRVFPKGFRKIAKDPLGYLRKALAKNDRRYHKTVFVAGFFLPRKQAKEGGKALVEALERLVGQKNLNYGRVVMCTLKQVTGWSLPVEDVRRHGPEWIKAWYDKHPR